MKVRRHWKFPTFALLFTSIVLAAPRLAHGQENSLLEANSAITQPPARNLIIVGFVGGFVNPNDTSHPEVQFAAYLRDRYPTAHAEVFGNHHGRMALHEVTRLLDTDHDGTLSSLEKEQATVIIYGHSWGATETVAFARKLDQMGVPVALTIQIDTIAKPGHKASAVPSNVASAINFYQSEGPLHGAPQIVAVDPDRTKIIGNLHMTYEDRPINCDNYSWYARTLNKPHHKIENDFRVWNEAASLIDADLHGAPSIANAPAPSASPFFQYLRRGPQAQVTDAALLESPADGTNQE